MAICKYGPLVSEVRGSIGGTTFTAGRFGRIVRQRRSPVHRPTTGREKWKNRFQTHATEWVSVLTPAERTAWENLGSNTNFTNSLGETYHPTGINLFVRSNTLLDQAHQANITAAPAQAVGTHYEITYTWDAVNGLMGEMVDVPGAVHTVLFWLGLESTSPINYYIGPFTLDQFGTSTSLHNAPCQLFTITEAKEHSYYFVRDRGIYYTGMATAPFISRVLCEV